METQPVSPSSGENWDYSLEEDAGVAFDELGDALLGGELEIELIATASRIEVRVWQSIGGERPTDAHVVLNNPVANFGKVGFAFEDDTHRHPGRFYEFRACSFQQPPPTGLHARGMTSREPTILLDWDDQPGVSFRVYRSDEQDRNYLLRSEGYNAFSRL